MSVNKNFVVKNGLEVATDVILADASTKNVGIGSTQPTFTLDVNGGIGAADLQVTGFTTLTQDLQVGASGKTLYVSSSSDNVGVGTSTPNSAYNLDVRSPVSTGQTALYVYGDTRVTGDIRSNKATINEFTVSNTLNVSGFTTFNDTVLIQDGLNVTGDGINSPNITAGVVTATSFVGEAQIGIGSEGSFIGTGVTMIDFKSANQQNTVDLSTGIATVTVQTGVSLGLAIAIGGF